MDLHTERRGAGPAVVLVHGFTQTSASWERIAAALEREHEVVLVDAPGHGRSAEVALDLVAGGRAIAEAAGRGVYVGYSMGGRFCLHAALVRPDLVTGLVLLGATAGIEDDGERAERRARDLRTAQRLEDEGLDAFLDGWLAQPLFATLPPERAGLEDRRTNTVAGLRSSLERAGTGSQHPLWHRLGELSMPVLLVAGEHDATFRALADRMCDAIGAGASVAAVPDAGHAAHLEQPDAFVAILRAWLAEHAR